MTTPSDPQDQQSEKKNQEPKEKKRKDGRWVAEITLENGQRKPLYGRTQGELKAP